MEKNEELNELIQDKEISGAIPLIIHEFDKELARQEKRQRRLVFVILILIAVILAETLAWIHLWSKYDVKSYAAMSTRGNANVIGQDGDIYNGSGSDDAE